MLAVMSNGMMMVIMVMEDGCDWEGSCEMCYWRGVMMMIFMVRRGVGYMVWWWLTEDDDGDFGDVGDREDKRKRIRSVKLGLMIYVEIEEG